MKTLLIAFRVLLVLFVVTMIGARRVAYAGCVAAGASWSPDGRQVLIGDYFTFIENGEERVSAGIFVMNADGSHVRQLGEASFETLPRWSPDGNLIAFTGFLENNDTLIIASSSDDSAPSIYPLGAFFLNDLIWALDGTHLFGFNRYANSSEGFVSVRVSDGETQHIADGYQISNYALSPNGSQIAFTGRGGGSVEDQVYVVDTDGENLRNVSHNQQASFLAWSPDGIRLAYSDGQSEVYVVNADGTGSLNVTNSAADDHFSGWSPDGGEILFASERDGNWEVYLVNADGHNLRNLSTNSALDNFPQWSPDGSQIIFYSERDGSRDIYIMNSDSSNPRRVTQTVDPDTFEAWSPDGSHFAFTSSRGPNASFFYTASAISLEHELVLSGDELRFVGWSADGSQLLFQESGCPRRYFVMNHDGSSRIALEFP
jgi:Tol biopolymer transport system component